MAATLLTVGLLCIVAAIVGGGLSMAGWQIPVLTSVRRQVTLGAFGLALLAAIPLLSHDAPPPAYGSPSSEPPPAAGSAMPSPAAARATDVEYLSDLKIRLHSNYNLYDEQLYENRVPWNPGNIRIGQVSYTKGLVFLIGQQGQTASIEYELNGRYTRFEAEAGVAGQTPVPDACRGSVILRVYVDDVLKFDGGPYRIDMRAEHVSVPLNGAHILKLEADSSDGSIACDQAAWGNAMLVRN